MVLEIAPQLSVVQGWAETVPVLRLELIASWNFMFPEIHLRRTVAR